MHDLMNISFVLLGLTMIIGSIFMYYKLHRSSWTRLGLILMSLAGLGTILVGTFPENSISAMHIIGASLPFVAGNLSLIILGFSLKMPKILRFYSVLSGILAIFALILFLQNTYLGIGIGGMERLTANLQTLWLITFGAYNLSYEIKQRI